MRASKITEIDLTFLLEQVLYGEGFDCGFYPPYAMEPNEVRRRRQVETLRAKVCRASYLSDLLVLYEQAKQHKVPLKLPNDFDLTSAAIKSLLEIRFEKGIKASLIKCKRLEYEAIGYNPDNPDFSCLHDERGRKIQVVVDLSRYDKALANMIASALHQNNFTEIKLNKILCDTKRQTKKQMEGLIKAELAELRSSVSSSVSSASNSTASIDGSAGSNRFSLFDAEVEQNNFYCVRSGATSFDVHYHGREVIKFFQHEKNNNQFLLQVLCSDNEDEQKQQQKYVTYLVSIESSVICFHINDIKYIECADRGLAGKIKPCVERCMSSYTSNKLTDFNFGTVAIVMASIFQPYCGASSAMDLSV